MYLYPNELAAMIGMPQIAQSLWAISPAVFLVCLTSAYRGYCQGRQNMLPTTVGQVLEVLVKVIFGLVLAWYLVRAGKSLPIASAGAISGVTVGSLVALGYMYVYKRRFYPERAIAAADTPDSSLRILRRIIRIGVPITLGASILNLINFIDTILVSNRLQTAAGFSVYDSSVLFGVYGKAQTLYNLPASIITPLCISVVPAIAACMARSSRMEASRIAENSLRISVVVALPMGAGLSVLAYPIMNGVYAGSNAAGPALLTLLGAASFFVCFALMQNAILQAHGNELFTMLSVITGVIVKVSVNWVLLADPDINILGAPIGTLCCYAVICVMNYIFLSRCLKNRPRLGRILLRPLLSAAVMGAGAWAVYGFAIRFISGGVEPGVWPIRLALVVAVGAGVLLYLFMVVTTRAITRDDMMLIPKGDKLARFLHIR